VVINRELLAQVGGIRVDYLTGPFRRGFHVQATSQAGSCSSESCSC